MSPTPWEPPPDNAERFSLRESAEAAGLRYVTDAQPGIRRRRRGRGFSYTGSAGKPIRDPKTLARIRSLVIPPAWRDVWICPKANGHIQVTGRDSRGRKQYRYHSRYRKVRDETKFDRMLSFSELLPTIRKRVERDMLRPGLPREKVLATVVRLLEKTLIRVGSDVYAKENRSFGLTTLKNHHVAVTGSQLRFEFRGKSGVAHKVAITSKRIARIVQQCQTLPGQELFQYLDDNGRRQDVDSGDINDYLKQITGKDISAKDFRTWAGTMYAATTLRDMGPATTKREAKRNIVRAIDRVAERLGNTRTVCRKYYVHPDVIDGYMRGKVVGESPPPPTTKRGGRPATALRRDEIRVLEFLQLQRSR